MQTRQTLSKWGFWQGNRKTQFFTEFLFCIIPLTFCFSCGIFSFI